MLIKEFEEYKEFEGGQETARSTSGGEPLYRVSQDLAALPPSRVAAGKHQSRRLPRMTQRMAALLTFRTEALGQSAALGRSREPLVLTRSGQTCHRTNIVTSQDTR